MTDYHQFFSQKDVSCSNLGQFLQQPSGPNLIPVRRIMVPADPCSVLNVKVDH